MRILQSRHVASKWRLDVTITVIVIALLMGIVLDQFSNLQLGLEKEKVHTQVQYFRIGLTEAWLSRNIEHKSTNISAFENTNPMLLIAEIPDNYIGEFAQTPQNSHAVWFYNTQLKQFIYILNNGELLLYKLAKSEHNTKNVTLPNGGLDLIAIQQ